MKKLLYLAIAILLFYSATPTVAAVIDGRFYPMQETTAVSLPIDKLPGHFNNKIKIFFSDIDGTIMPFDKSGQRKMEISEQTKLAVKKLQQAKIPLVLTTGRSIAEAKEIAQKMGLDKTYIITQQGGEIFMPDGKLVYSDAINNKDSIKMLNEIDLYKKNNDPNLKYMFYVNSKLYAKENFIPPYNVSDNVIVVNSINDMPVDFKVLKLAIIEHNPQKLKEIKAYMHKKFPQYPVYISADCYCDVINSSTSKGNAMKRLAKMLKVDLKNTAAMGDAENDISMINQARLHHGLGLAVGNAMTSVKANSNYVTAPVTENGFAKAVDKIIENNTLLH